MCMCECERESVCACVSVSVSAYIVALPLLHHNHLVKSDTRADQKVSMQCRVVQHQSDATALPLVFDHNRNGMNRLTGRSAYCL